MSLADLHRYEFVRPASLAEACSLASERDQAGKKTALLAGGTDFMVQLSQGRIAPDPLPLVVDVSRLEELQGLSLEGDVLRIGAAVSYLEMGRSALVLEHAPLVASMTRDIGGPTIQARGTLGGNLATGSPAADGVTALAACDATIVVQSVRGTRRIPIAALQTGYKTTSRASDELIVAVELRAQAPGSIWTWRKVGTRLAQAISKVAFAGLAEIAEGRVTRVGLGMASVAPTTSLLGATRELLFSRPLAALDGAALDAAVAYDVSPIDDVRSTRAYRIHTAKAVVRAFVRELGAAV